MARVQVAQCPKCKRLQGEKHKATMKTPSFPTLERWSDNGAARATDGCKVESDGVCQHGHNSWLIVLGLI